MSALQRIVAVANGASLLGRFDIDTNPAPASRPRLGRWGGIHYAKGYSDWIKEARKLIRKGHLDLAPNAELLVVVEQIIAKPRTGKRPYPRGDLDNFVKGPLDMTTQATGWWCDDDQITYLLTCKRYAEPNEQPRTVMEIYSP